MSGGVNGTVCSAEEYASSIVSPDNEFPTIYCLTRGQSVGLAFAAESAFISFVSVTGVFLLIARNVLRHKRAHPKGKWRLLREPTDVYMFSLLVLDAVQAMGNVLDVRWVNIGKVFTGSYCNAQGIIQQFGELGVALSTLVITIHTFNSVFWRKGIHSRRIAYIVIATVWTFVALWVGIGSGVNDSEDAPYFTPTPYWCWISPRYSGERIGGEYLWLWAALFSSVLVYIPLYFWSQGMLSVDARRWWRFRVHRPLEVQDLEGRRRRAYTILAYPFAYSVVVLPLSVVRFTDFGLAARGEGNLPSIATFIVAFLYSLSGAVNVLLLVFTRPNLLLFGMQPGDLLDDDVIDHKRSMSQDSEMSAAAIPPTRTSPSGRLADETQGTGWDLPAEHSSITSGETAVEGRQTV
ncbi:hypothetical protein OF83DRAFT_1064113 [Amylostereum chailletii]|nr:hypothetical protein OF83DRAFT_1064113 [Amylostereum chailletii]